MKKIRIYEPIFFIFFGLFHMHRIWGLFDRKGYSNFWINVMENKSIFYYILMIILVIFCILGIITYIKNIKNNYWWRYIYIFGGTYVLFDLFAIATKLDFWHTLILKMFDVNEPYWNLLWGFFIIIGSLSFTLGINLLIKRKRD